MDIAADEKKKNVVYALDTTGDTASQSGQRPGVASHGNQLPARRIRKRHDHPGQARYPLIGAILRA